MYLTLSLKEKLPDEKIYNRRLIFTLDHIKRDQPQNATCKSPNGEPNIRYVEDKRFQNPKIIECATGAIAMMKATDSSVLESICIEGQQRLRQVND